MIFFFTVELYYIHCNTFHTFNPMPTGGICIHAMAKLDSSPGGMFTHATHIESALSCVLLTVVCFLAMTAIILEPQPLESRLKSLFSSSQTHGG